MDFKLELVQIPVSDEDRANEFYAAKAGFTVDARSGLRTPPLNNGAPP